MSKVLIDTSIWIDYFKDKYEIADTVEKLIDGNSALITGPVIGELLQGARNDSERTQLAEAITSIPYLDCGMDDWIEAGSICSDLRKKGMTVPLIDALIAAVSHREGVKVFTHDKHFSLIPNVELFKTK